MSTINPQIQVKVAWWFRLWLNGLFLVAVLSDREPDPEKVAVMARRGIKLKTKVVLYGQASNT